MLRPSPVIPPRFALSSDALPLGEHERLSFPAQFFLALLLPTSFPGLLVILKDGIEALGTELGLFYSYHQGLVFEKKKPGTMLFQPRSQGVGFLINGERLTSSK